jgi:AP-1 complex subunit beta-1
MHQNNVFTVAKRNLEGQDMVYQAIKFSNNVWALTELKIQPGNPNITVKVPTSQLSPNITVKIPTSQ